MSYIDRLAKDPQKATLSVARTLQPLHHCELLPPSPSATFPTGVPAQDQQREGKGPQVVLSVSEFVVLILTQSKPRLRRPRTFLEQREAAVS